MTFHVRRPSSWLAAVLLCASAPALAANDADLVVGDIAQILIPAAALGMTYYFDDPAGRRQWMQHTGATLLATEVLKYSLNRTALGQRPNGGDRGFPSGHTSAACGGAFFLGERYGYQYAAPALGLAFFTGYSRADEGYHHWRDVIAGCALGYASSRYFVSSQASGVTVTPIVGSRLAGVRLSLAF